MIIVDIIQRICIGGGGRGGSRNIGFSRIVIGSEGRGGLGRGLRGGEGRVVGIRSEFVEVRQAFSKEIELEVGNCTITI